MLLRGTHHGTHVADISQPSRHPRTHEHMELHLHYHFTTDTHIDPSCSRHKAANYNLCRIGTAKTMVLKKDPKVQKHGAAVFGEARVRTEGEWGGGRGAKPAMPCRGLPTGGDLQGALERLRGHGKAKEHRLQQQVQGCEEEAPVAELEGCGDDVVPHECRKHLQRAGPTGESGGNGPGACPLGSRPQSLTAMKRTPGSDLCNRFAPASTAVCRAHRTAQQFDTTHGALCGLQRGVVTNHHRVGWKGACRGVGGRGRGAASPSPERPST